MQLAVRVKPAKKKRQGRNPATGEEITIAAKPASVDVRARPLARAKEAHPSVHKTRRLTNWDMIVITDTEPDAPYILDGLLDPQTRVRPREIMTDTAGYTDIIFGLFRLLGYRCSPRLADSRRRSILAHQPHQLRGA